jgi:hypothetical protein
VSPLPYPAPTDPAGAAARHIRTLAEAVDTKLAAGSITVRTFAIDQTADANGDIFSGALTPISVITGAVFGPQAENAGGSPDFNYIPALTWRPAGNAMALRCYNAPNLASNAGKRQQAVGLAFGPTAAAAGSAEPAPAAADTFPRGVTPHAKLRYPGTDEPLWRTAQAVEDLAGDAGAAIGGAVSLGLITWRDPNVQLNASGYAIRSISGVSRIRGAVLTAWDTGNFVRKSRIIAWIPPDRTGDGGATAGNVLRMRAYTNVAYTTGVTYPKPAYSDLLGVMGVIWGDP